ncbi:MAG: hypothetical protein JWP01_2346 [Myxococcales bacterium]|nr:hypothetical protein [Myxococcales bacterium]
MIRTLVIAFVLAACSSPGKGNGPSSAPSPSAPPSTNDPGSLSPPIESGAVTPLPTTPTPTSTNPEPPTAANASKADGASCLESAECSSGVCEGEGCGADQPGTCKPKMRACTRDLRAYCGCDGTTFQTSGSCPGKRFSARGQCVK